VHSTTCNGPFCRDTDAMKWFHETMDSNTLPPEVEPDCGKWCSAVTFLHEDVPFIPFSFDGLKMPISLVYEATDEVWRRVQCASVTDSCTSTRACCACSDPTLCPFTNFETTNSGYCDDPCKEDDSTCKQLAAGCGVSVFDASQNWGSQQCSQESIKTGECELCKIPMWCDNPAFDVNDADDWMRLFHDKDGGRAAGSRQCKWRNTQKHQFVETMRARYSKRKYDVFDHVNLWNEVNFYVGPGDASLKHVLWRNLIGLMFVRTYGDVDDLRNIRKLRTHFRSLGAEIPMFVVDAEGLGETIDWWYPNEKVNLRAAPYNLEPLN